ncbi:ShlB/FhaC/HecB family hemolysin secretion/activation protein [Bradyrhizobium sp.]|uniref:ShlB/FhaC/HecB family hemolysin secretion/activation protein n=1 Tax=Bradyrhizobium sp. TaxID=376 RepID=UPI002D4FD88D|nr:ShlB/FhaC/HecB family hemolysin secretion/activation protein [Bradyrhizobium sp.]HZR77295.1 ShlB/FhaC/HecB family hemolysin secretion/activation protein [Bradyrhizobium sp.]
MHLRMLWRPAQAHLNDRGATSAVGDRRAQRLAGAFAALLALLPAAGRAEQASPAYDPRQFDQRFGEGQFERAPAVGPNLPMPKLARPAEAAADPTPLFVLRHVSIVGATTISPGLLAVAYQPYIGRKVSQADLAAIAGSISDIYRAAGFHLSRAIVPPQDISDGTIRIQVIEGSITEVDLKGEGAEEFGVRQMLAPVLAEQPSRLATLERRLVLVSGRPGVRIQDTTLEEIGNASGHFRLTVFVKTWQVYASFGIDNLGSSSVGPWQSYATAAYNSLARPGDTLAVNLSTTPNDPRELGFARLSYDTPIGNDGFRVGASAYYSDVWPGDYRHAFADNTTTEGLQLRGSFAPLQSQRASLILTAALDVSNVSESDMFGPIYTDRIRTVSLTADSRLQDNFGGNNYLTVTWRQGLDILGASSYEDAFVSHLGASPTFSTLNAWFTRYQTLADAWSLKIAGAGQVASGPLYLSQQFYLGGAAFGRGYSAAETSGDNGMAGTLELRFDQKLNSKYLSGYQLYSFVDSGVAWNSGFRYTDGISLVSVGGGVRFFLSNATQADLSVAAPLSYRAPDNPGRDVRVLFSLTSALELCPTKASTHCL